jgi:hypothetical protein
VPAEQLTIPATSGGLKPGARTRLEFDLLLHHAVELPGARARKATCAENGDVLEERWEPRYLG